MNRDLKKVREQASRYLIGKVVQAEGTTCANILRQACAWCVLGSVWVVTEVEWGNHEGEQGEMSCRSYHAWLCMPFGNFGFYTQCFGKALEGFEQRGDPTIKGPLYYCV